MTGPLLALLAVLSVWDYPARFPQHQALRAQFVSSLRANDRVAMESSCRKGVELLPDDPTWHYNLACALAHSPARHREALDELEKAIDLGFRSADAIAADGDLKRLAKNRRYLELIEYAKEMATRPILTGPLATVDATGTFGASVALGEQNLVWDFDVGAFLARLRLSETTRAPWTGDLYMNRDGDHSPNGPEAKKRFLADFPGITEVRFDAEGRRRGLDLNAPNVCLPYPTFGNSSRAFVGSPYWRSISRALVTVEASKLPLMEKLYLSNQVWVFPSNADTAPVGTNGDVFASITPYWITTAGRSWSDLPYLKAALLASAALPRDVKAEAVRRGLLTPTILTLVRKSLRGVRSDDDYLSARAHPTAFPPNAVDTNRLVAAAREMTIDAIAPVVPIAVESEPTTGRSAWPELTYRTRFAWAYVLRADDETRVFKIATTGAEDFCFVCTHGAETGVKIERLQKDVARVTLDRAALSPTQRVDIAVFGRNAKTSWGAPSYVSFSRMDPSAPYSDPVLTRDEKK